MEGKTPLAGERAGILLLFIFIFFFPELLWSFSILNDRLRIAYLFLIFAFFGGLTKPRPRLGRGFADWKERTPLAIERAGTLLFN